MKPLKVTRRDVQDAALVGQIIAESALAETDVTCAVDDDDCCGHMLEEHCVAEAIEASGMAVLLWLVVSNAISNPLHQRTKDIAEAEVPGEKQRLERLYAWVDTVSGHIAMLGLVELHAAALLRDGVLPPDWKIVPGRAGRTHGTAVRAKALRYEWDSVHQLGQPLALIETAAYVAHGKRTRHAGWASRGTDDQEALAQELRPVRKYKRYFRFPWSTPCVNSRPSAAVT